MRFTMNKRSIIILALSCFLLGGAVGVIGMQQVTRKRIKHIIEMQRPPKIKKHLEQVLELDEAQTARYNAIFKEHIKIVRNIHHNERDSLRIAMDNLFNNLAEELHPHQVTRLREFEDQMRRNHRERMRRERP